MFDLINGIPLHPLVVHAVVVLLPLATFGAIAIALRPSWRVRYGPFVVAAAALSTLFIPIATSSGEALERRVGDPGRHTQLGDQLIWFAVPLLLLSAALVWLEWRREHDDAAPRPQRITQAVAILVVVAALASAVQVYRVGDSGARAAWGDVPAAQSAPAGG